MTSRLAAADRRFVLVVVALGLGLLAAACSGGGVEMIGSDEVGRDPFIEDVGMSIPDELKAIQDGIKEAADLAQETLEAVDESSVEENSADESDGEAVFRPGLSEILSARQLAAVERARAEGLEVTAPTSDIGVGLYGGSGENVCDTDAMLAFFAANPEVATAWAGVHGIETSEIESYLSSLTAGYLIDDYEVINHTFKDGQAQPFNAVLETGTAVMVDDDGVPRVRCKCGNPLLAELTILDGQAVTSSAFADRAVEVRLGADALESYDDGPTGNTFSNDPEATLGAPDGNALGLGDDPDASEDRCEVFVIVEFVDNRLIDLPGPDLKIVELGLQESSYVSVGSSVDDFRFVGEVRGGTRSFDISEVVEPGEEMAFVRICDGPENNSEVPGTDIDAIAALSSVPK